MLVIVFASILVVGPALVHPGARVAGLPGDPSAEVWSLHELGAGRLGLVRPSTSTMINVPDGSPQRRPVAITTAVVDTAGWAGAHLFGASVTRNLLLLAGTVANGLAMLFAARRLRLADVAATVASVLFLAAPSLIVETRLHVALVNAWTVPLAFAIGVALRDDPRVRHGIALGAVVGLSCYVNPYLPLYTAAVAVVVVVATWSRHRGRATRAVLAAVAATALVASPALVLLTLRRSETIADVDRSLAELDQYATRPADLLRAFGPWPLGLLVLAGVAGGLLAASRDRWSRRRVPMLVACAVAGALLCLGPYAQVAGVRVPMPNRALFAVYPVWRVVGRAAVLVWFAAAAVLGFALDAAVGAGAGVLRRRRRRGVARATALVALAGVVGALTWWGASFRGGRPWRPVDETPSLAALVASRDGVVAEYPLFGQENDALGAYLLRQVVHGRPLLNGGVAGTTSASLSAAAAHLDDPQTPAALALAGVRTVVVHGPGAPAGATLVGEVDGAVVYAPPPVADPAVATWEGTSPEESSGALRWRWLGARPLLRVTSAAPGRYLVRVLVAAAPGVDALRFGDSAPVPIGAERAVEVCVETRPGAAGGLATGAVTVVADVVPVALGPGDPRRSWARVRAEQVVGRCQ